MEPLDPSPLDDRREVQARIDYVRNRLEHLLRVALLLAISIIIIAPIVWAVSTSLRPAAESFSVPPDWLPSNPQWDHYRRVFEVIPYGRYILNSTIVTGSIVIGQIITTAMAGYAFARLEFPGRDIIFWLILATLMIPLQATIIPVFVLVSRIGLADTLAALILPALSTAFGTFLMRQYFMTVPHELEEAALIDGANQFQIFWKVYLPLVKTGLAVLAVLSFNVYWNEFFRPLIFLDSREKFTLPLGLVDLQGYLATGSLALIMAGFVLSLIPVLIIFVLGQRYLIEGIMRSGLKG